MSKPIEFWYGFAYNITNDSWSLMPNSTKETYADRAAVAASIGSYNDRNGLRPEMLRDTPDEVVIHPNYFTPDRVIVYRRIVLQPPANLPATITPPTIPVTTFTVTLEADIEMVRNYIASQVSLRADHIFVDVTVSTHQLRHQCDMLNNTIKNRSRYRRKCDWNIVGFSIKTMLRWNLVN